MGILEFPGVIRGGGSITLECWLPELAEGRLGFCGKGVVSSITKDSEHHHGLSSTSMNAGVLQVRDGAGAAGKN